MYSGKKRRTVNDRKNISFGKLSNLSYSKSNQEQVVAVQDSREQIRNE